MALLQHLSVLLLLAASRGQDTGTSNVNANGTGPVTDVKLPDIKEASSAVPPTNSPPQDKSVPDKIKDLAEGKVLLDTKILTDGPQLKENQNPQITVKQINQEDQVVKKLLNTEPDAIKKDLGGRCSTDTDCSSVNNTYCKDQICVCNSGFIPSKHSLEKCVKVPAGLFEACEEEAQCEHTVPDSECRDGQCQCPLNYFFKQNRCWQKQMLGGTCNMTEQCDSVTSAICTQGVCDCEPPLIPSPSNKCLEVAGKQYKAVCEEDIQCSLSYGDEARCSHGQCLCTNSYHYNGTTCIIDKKLGESCSADLQCEVSEVNNEEESRICLDSACSCAIGYSSLPGEDLCSKSSGQAVVISLLCIISVSVAKIFLE